MGLPVTALLAALFVAGGTVGRALALEPGVHVDPSSPAAKEYALPLTQARSAGSPGGKGTASVLFGAGIVPRHAAPGTHRPAGEAASGRSGAGAQRRHANASGSASEARPGESSPSSPAGEDGASARVPHSSDALLALLGGGAGVLLVGALGGAILRRGHGGQAPSG